MARIEPALGRSPEEAPLPDPTIQKALITPLAAATEAEHAPTERLLADASLPTDFDEDPGGQVPERLLWRFLHLAARRLDCPAFGLIAGERARLENLGTFGLRLRQSLTLFDLLNTFERAVTQVSSHARFWTARSNGTSWFCREGMREIGGFESGRAEAEQWTLMFMLHLIRLAAGPTWRPSRIILQCERTPALTQARSISGIDLCFDQHVTAIALPPELFACPLRPATPRSGVVSELRSRLQPLLRDGHPDLLIAAEIAGMSPRSLQRRLGAEGLSYARLVDQVRFADACRMLASGDAPLIEIAFDLGYSDPAHFTRAFRRWAGITPSAYRRQHRSFGPVANHSTGAFSMFG
jgi:AraC-like DNA-binding protein